MNKWLHGNGRWCAACKATGRGRPLHQIVYESGSTLTFYEPCRACGGAKRIAAAFAEAARGAVPATPPPATQSLFSPLMVYEAPPCAR